MSGLLRSRKMMFTHSMINKCLLRACCVLGSGEAVVSETKSQLSRSVDVYEVGNVGQGCSGEETDYKHLGTCQFPVFHRSLQLFVIVHSCWPRFLQRRILMSVMNCVFVSLPKFICWSTKMMVLGFPGGAVVGSPPANAGDTGLSPGPGGSRMPWSG